VPDHITHQAFEEQFPRLILSARDLPRKRLPFNILLISAILRLDPELVYREAEINDQLQRWILEFGRNLPLEHVELRRYLVDAGYLTRDRSGSSYKAQSDAGTYSFDLSLRQVDLVELIAEARAERDARKRAHTQVKSS